MKVARSTLMAALIVVSLATIAAGQGAPAAPGRPAEEAVGKSAAEADREAALQKEREAERRFRLEAEARRLDERAAAEKARLGQEIVISSRGQAASVAADFLRKAQGETRERRLAVLKQLQAGQIDAEKALDLLDALPGPPTRLRLAGERTAWIRVRFTEGKPTAPGAPPAAPKREFELSVPLALVHWAVMEAPRIAPPPFVAELKKETGVDITQLDFSGLAATLEALGDVREPKTLLHVREGDGELEVTVEPEGARPRPTGYRLEVHERGEGRPGPAPFSPGRPGPPGGGMMEER